MENGEREIRVYFDKRNEACPYLIFIPNRVQRGEATLNFYTVVESTPEGSWTSLCEEESPGKAAGKRVALSDLPPPVRDLVQWFKSGYDPHLDEESEVEVSGPGR